MRELLRVGLRFIMILFLVAGCVQNVYYFGELAKNNDGYEYGYGYSSYSRYSSEEEDSYTNSITTTVDTVDAEPYPDYNRSVRAVRPY